MFRGFLAIEDLGRNLAQSANTLRWYMYIVLVSSPILPSYSSVVATCRVMACMSKRGSRTEHW